jgi:hypothetical protein
MHMSSSVIHMSNSRHAHEQFGLSHEQLGLSHEQLILSHEHFGPFFDPHRQRCRAVPHLFFPRPRRRASRISLTNTKSTMAECNVVVVDLVSITTDDDDSSSSSIDCFSDSFVMAFDNHGEAFVRNKVTIVDMDDETTSRPADQRQCFVTPHRGRSRSETEHDELDDEWKLIEKWMDQENNRQANSGSATPSFLPAASVTATWVGIR